MIIVNDLKVIHSSILNMFGTHPGCKGSRVNAHIVSSSAELNKTIYYNMYNMAILCKRKLCFFAIKDTNILQSGTIFHSENN